MVDARSKIITHYLSGNRPTEILKKLKHEKVNRMLVYRTIKRYKETSGITDKARSGRSPTARSIRLRKPVRSRVARNPRRSMRKMAKELEIKRESLRKLIHQDLGLKSLKRKTVHHLTPSICQKGLERWKGLLQRLGTEDFEKIIFSDEKLFTVEEATNRQNDRILSTTAKDIPEEVKFVDRVQKPQCVMVWGRSDGQFEDKSDFYPERSKNKLRNVQEGNTRAGSQRCRSLPIQKPGMDIPTGLSSSGCLKCDSILAQGAKYQVLVKDGMATFQPGPQSAGLFCVE
ncbi:MhmaT1 transposase [Oopsacas minuta]|uniref:MhmaT1 transposase n=1 Tax=Oopsacas minuta TaxID=111878 RepID=A0AAV7KCC5_9METZ|nr:MhmaT1 transposase [Oopsacas minuta]